MTSSSYKDQRLAQLSQNIQENLELLKAYERKRRLSKEPREQQEWDDQIADVKKLLDKDTKEKEDLESGREAQTAASDNNLQSKSTGQVTKQDDQLHDQLREIKDEMKRGFNDLKRGQGAIYQLLTETRNQELKTVIGLIQQGDVQQDEMVQMLASVKTALSALEQNQISLNDDVREVISNASSALNSEASLQGKLELTLPIIPLLLDYKVELGMTDSIDLNQIWENTQKWWKSLVTQISRRTLQLLISEYYEEFKMKANYLTEFEEKINQSVSNLNILIKADEELTDLARLSQSFVKKLENIREKIDYPRNDFERNLELATSIATASRSAATSVARNGNPNQQIDQIRRNMPVLRKTMVQLVSWYEQISIKLSRL